MCLKFERYQPEETGKLTLYKVYGIYEDGIGSNDHRLVSPWCGSSPNGSIPSAGTYEVPKPDNCYVRPARRALSQLIELRMLGDHVGWRLSIGGFHCIKNRADAESYLSYIRWREPNGRSDIKYVLVEIEVDAADVFACGRSPYDSIRTAEKTVETYVATKITITPEAFQKAIAQGEALECA